MAVATPVFLIFAPDRLRVGTRLLALAGAVALAAGPIFDVYDTGEVGGALGARPGRRGGGDPALGARGRAPPGCCSALAERAARGHERIETASRRAGLVGAVLLAVAVVALALVNLDRITDTVDEQWATLTGAEYDSVRGGADLEPRPVRAPRLLAGGDRPLPGVARDRRGHRQLRARVHGAQARAEALALRAQHVPARARRGRRRGRGPARGASSCRCSWPGRLLRRRLARAPALVLATTLAIAAYFAVHLNFDWLEEIPAVASPALALPLVALVAAARPAARGAPRRPARAARAGAWAAGGARRGRAGRRSCPPTCRCAT